MDTGGADGAGGVTTGAAGGRRGRARGPADLLLVIAMLIVAHLGAALLDLAVVAAAIVVGVAHAGGAGAGAALLVALALVGAAALLAGVTVAAPLPGVAILPAEEPELAALVADVARRSELEQPLLLRAVPDVDAALVVTRLRGRRTAVVMLGVPLLRRLAAPELAAIVAHELAHRGEALDRRTAVFLAARDRLAASAEGGNRVRRRLALPLLVATRDRAWGAELDADARAATVVGSGAARGALAATSVLATAFEQFAVPWVEHRRAHCPDLYDALDAVLDDPHLSRRLREQGAALDACDPGPRSSHPPGLLRLGALADRGSEPDGAGGVGPGPAPVRLRGGDGLAHRAALVLAEDLQAIVGPDGMRLVRLLDGDGPVDPVPAETAVAALAHALGVDAPPRDVVRLALERIAAGDGPLLARGLTEVDAHVVRPDSTGLHGPADDEVARRLLALVVGAACGPLLLRAGWTRLSRFAPDVLRDPEGRVRDVQLDVWHAVAEGPTHDRLALLRAALDAGTDTR